MSEDKVLPSGVRNDVAPGDEPDTTREVGERRAYYIGLGLATLITIVAFYLTSTSLVWHPSIPIALFVLAIAQMGVHLVFFLHITTGPDNTNNVLALAFGLLIVTLIVIGTLSIMMTMNHNMMMGMHLPM